MTRKMIAAKLEVFFKIQKNGAFRFGIYIFFRFKDIAVFVFRHEITKVMTS